MLIPAEIEIDRTYTKRAVSGLLALNERTVAKMVERGQLSAVAIADRVEITGRSLAELVEKIAGVAK